MNDSSRSVGVSFVVLLGVVSACSLVVSLTCPSGCRGVTMVTAPSDGLIKEKRKQHCYFAHLFRAN